MIIFSLWYSLYSFISLLEGEREGRGFNGSRNKCSLLIPKGVLHPDPHSPLRSYSKIANASSPILLQLLTKNRQCSSFPSKSSVGLDHSVDPTLWKSQWKELCWISLVLTVGHIIMALNIGQAQIQGFESSQLTQAGQDQLSSGAISTQEKG